MFVIPNLPPLLEHIHVAINELKSDDPLDQGESKLCWRYVLIQSTTSSVVNDVLRAPTVLQTSDRRD